MINPSTKVSEDKSALCTNSTYSNVNNNNNDDDDNDCDDNYDDDDKVK